MFSVTSRFEQSYRCVLNTVRDLRYNFILTGMSKFSKLKEKEESFVNFLSSEFIIRKRYRLAKKFLKDNPQPKLSQSEKDEIDDFWKRYGVKFPDYSWFEMYYSVTGIRDPKFIPDPFVGGVLYAYYNDAKSIDGWDDKNLYDKLVSSVSFPKVYCHYYRGDYYDGSWNYYSPNELDKLSNLIFEEATSKNEQDFVVKKTRNGSFGKGVQLLSFNSPQDITSILKSRKSDFVIQEKVHQHPFFNQFNKSSVNILRVISFRHKGEIKILSASIRYGIEGAFTDVSFVKGKEIVNVCGINEDGIINERCANLDGRIAPPQALKEKVLPGFNEVIKQVKIAHQQLFPFGIVGWDIAIDINEKPVFIEYNIHWPGTMLYQYANGPYGGKYTENLLEFLTDKDNQKRYIPGYFRL